MTETEYLNFVEQIILERFPEDVHLAGGVDVVRALASGVPVRVSSTGLKIDPTDALQFLADLIEVISGVRKFLKEILAGQENSDEDILKSVKVELIKKFPDKSQNIDEETLEYIVRRTLEFERGRP